MVDLGSPHCLIWVLVLQVWKSLEFCRVFKGSSTMQRIVKCLLHVKQTVEPVKL